MVVTNTQETSTSAPMVESNTQDTATSATMDARNAFATIGPEADNQAPPTSSESYTPLTLRTIPPEMRNHIFDLKSIKPDPKTGAILPISVSELTKTDLAPTQINTALRPEVSSIFYQTHVFHFEAFLETLTTTTTAAHPPGGHLLGAHLTYAPYTDPGRNITHALRMNVPPPHVCAQIREIKFTLHPLRDPVVSMPSEECEEWLAPLERLRDIGFEKLEGIDFEVPLQWPFVCFFLRGRHTEEERAVEVEKAVKLVWKKVDGVDVLAAEVKVTFT